MRKLPALVFALALAGHSSLAQSGRRVPPPEPAATPVETARPPAAEAAPVRRTAPRPLSHVPEQVLNQELRSLEDGRFRLADFRDKVVVVNLWATWCGPCRAEIPELEVVHREYASKGVELIGVTTENPATDGQRVRKFVRDARLSYRVAWIDRPTAAALTNGANVIPQTFVIGPDGRVVRHIRGYSRGRSDQMLREAIDHALESRTAPAGGENR